MRQDDPPISLASVVPLRILLLGFGNVAQAFVPLLASRAGWLEQTLGIRPLICGIGTRSQGFFIDPEGIEPSQLVHGSVSGFKRRARSVRDADAFVEEGRACGAALLIELTALHPSDGQPALNHIRAALQAGMDVVTANKGPLAHALSELEALARLHHVHLRFESAVMDGLPLMNLAQFTLPAVGFLSFRALLNATTSLVLHLIEQGHSSEQAVSKAQESGIAEADPTYDLDGWDAVMKTTILANILLCDSFSAANSPNSLSPITPAQVKRAGIRSLSLEEIREANKRGTPLRLVSQACIRQGEIIAEVRPQAVMSHDPLSAGSNGATSVITMETQAMGTITLIEHEPTVMQTAYGVLSDMITIQQEKRLHSIN